MTNPLRLLVADDDPYARRALATILGAETDIEVVGTAADGLEAVEQATTLRPDVTVMDIRMPRLDGVEATKRMVAHGPSAGRILVLTTFLLEGHVYDALRAGASGFMLKNSPPDELAVAVRIVASGESLLSPEVTRLVVERYVTRPPSGRSYRPPELDSLTPRELEVMEQVARGLTNRELAEAMFLSEATVKTHVARVLMKLRLRDRVQVVVAAYETGLIVPGDVPPTRS